MFGVCVMQLRCTTLAYSASVVGRKRERGSCCGWGRLSVCLAMCFSLQEMSRVFCTVLFTAKSCPFSSSKVVVVVALLILTLSHQRKKVTSRSCTCV